MNSIEFEFIEFNRISFMKLSLLEIRHLGISLNHSDVLSDMVACSDGSFTHVLFYYGFVIAADTARSSIAAARAHCVVRDLLKPLYIISFHPWVPWWLRL